MENSERLLKASFVGAANQLTQLYVLSLQQQKHSFVSGYQTATDSLMQFILNSNSASIPVDVLLDFIRKEQAKCNQMLASSEQKNEESRSRPMNEITQPPSRHSSFVPSTTSSSSTHAENNFRNFPVFNFQDTAAIAHVNSTVSNLHQEDNARFTFGVHHDNHRSGSSTSSNTPSFSMGSAPSTLQVPPFERQHATPSSTLNNLNNSESTQLSLHARQQHQVLHQTVNSPRSSPTASSGNNNYNGNINDGTAKKRPMDFVFNVNPWLNNSELWSPMDQMLKKVKIDQ
jgi:hypothetical protein